MARRKLKLRLKEISLKGIDKKGSGRISTRKQYLADFGCGLHFGQFTKQWYGLNFDCDWGASGMQFDPPGENSSDWHQLWEVVR